MMDIKELERLAPTADEMLSGLHADETMKRRILSAAREEKKRSVSMPRLGARALLCGAGGRLHRHVRAAAESDGRERGGFACARLD